MYNLRGKQKTARTYSAEYRTDGGKQACESLGTNNKVQARRKALEIQQRLESGEERVIESSIQIDELIDRYTSSVKAKQLTPKTESKYAADLVKLKDYCAQKHITLARRFSADDWYAFREWLSSKKYADKTVQGAVMLAKQVFEWAWRQGILKEYRLAVASIPKAKSKPQPCFTSEQVDQLLEVAEGEEKPAYALMAYAGLRIGEVEQLRWEDLRLRDGRLAMIHVRRGGSAGVTKDKEDRFVPVHPKVAELLQPMVRNQAAFSTKSFMRRGC